MNSSVPATERDKFWLEENQYSGYDLEKFSNYVDRLTENHWTEEKARQEVAKMLGLKRKPRDNWEY